MLETKPVTSPESSSFVGSDSSPWQKREKLMLGRTERTTWPPLPEPRSEPAPTAAVFEKLLTASDRRGVVVHRCQRSDNSTFSYAGPAQFEPDLKDTVNRSAQFPASHQNIIEDAGKYLIIAASRSLRENVRCRVTLQRFELRQFTDADYNRLMIELTRCKLLVHAHIVTYHGIFWEDESGVPQSITIVRERMDFLLEQYYGHISKGDGNPKEEKLRDHRLTSALLVQGILGLQFLLEHGILHTDIQPRSIGVNSNGFVIKFLDCGGSRSFAQRPLDQCTPQDHFIYQAPEVLRDATQYTLKSAVWSLGATAAEMLGVKPFYPRAWTPQQIRLGVLEQIEHVLQPDAANPQLNGLDKVVPLRRFEQPRGPLTGRPIPSHINKLPFTGEHFMQLLKRMLQAEPEQRPTLDECLGLPYLQLMHFKYNEAHQKLKPSAFFSTFIQRL